jgi:hypothetical protein
MLRKLAVLSMVCGSSFNAWAAETPHAFTTHPDLGLLSVIGLGILGGGVFSAMRTRRHERR